MSKRKRSKLHAAMKSITREFDDRPTGNKISREQWVIDLVTRVVGTTAGNGHCQADDIASDVLLALLDVGGFAWEEGEIATFARKKAFSACKSFAVRQEIAECDFKADEDGITDILARVTGSYSALQPIVVDAKNAFRRVMALPTLHRQALTILCDGGNPIDVAEELEITPWLAIKLIKEAREYIDRVDPLDEAA